MINARGNKELKKHLSGEKLTQRQMILAKCAECMNYYADGKIDCEIPGCPPYPLSAYGKHPVFKSRASHTMSVEQLKRLARGRIRAKANKVRLDGQEQEKQPQIQDQP